MYVQTKDPSKVESELEVTSTQGTGSRKVIVCLTLRQMRKKPYFFPKEKCEWIAANRKGIEDEDFPGGPLKYWVNVMMEAEDYKKNQPLYSTHGV